MIDLLDKPLKSYISTDQLIKLNFFLLIFFTFLGGVRIPFQEFDYYETFEAETSNVANQVLYLFLFFSTLFVIMRRFDKTLSFIRNEKSQSLFILLCLASALWSDYPELSIKRSFQLFVMFIVVVEALVNIDPRILLRQLQIIISIYLFFNLFACRFVPAAIDPMFGTWRGIELQKNLLAQSSFYCLLSSMVFFNFDETRLKKIYNVVLMLVALILIYKAHSSTITISVAILISLGVVFGVENIFKKFGFGRSILGLTFLFILFFSIIFIIFSSELFGLIPGYFGKDMTLSGRTDIWSFVWNDIEKRLFLGYGFATYWIMGSPRLEIFASLFEGFKVNEAHNGYLEIMLQLGVIGFLFFLLPIIAYVYRMFRINSNLAIVVLISILILNYTESFLFKVGMGVTTFFFIVSYVTVSVFYFNLSNNQKNENHY